MTDIVERLRAWEPMVSSGYECPAAGTAIHEAAAELDRLRAEVERLGKKLNVARYGEPDFAWSIHQAQMADLRTTNERLTKALEKISLMDKVHEHDLFSATCVARAALAEEKKG